MALRGSVPHWMRSHDCDEADRAEPPLDGAERDAERLWGEVLREYPPEWPGVHLMADLEHRLEAGHRMPRWVRNAARELESKGYTAQHYHAEREHRAQQQSGFAEPAPAPPRPRFAKTDDSTYPGVHRS